MRKFPGGVLAVACGLWAVPCAAQPYLLAYGGRVVPPMTAPLVEPKEEAPTPAPPPKRTWDHALPFMAQRVIDLGVDLPNPYNFAVNGYFGDELRTLSSLEVGFNGNPLQDLGFVGFPKSRIKYQAYQLQAGAWIFPFLNAYLIAGTTQGKGDIDITIDGGGLMSYLGLPGCNLPLPARPELCSRTLAGTAKADYHGKTYGMGITAAGAYKGLFFALPITYVVSDVTMSTTKGKTWNIAPRAGWNHHLGPDSFLTFYGGGTYLKSDVHITGEFTFDTGGTVIGRDTTLAYAISVRPKSAWNLLTGVNWTISRHWGALAEIGFGGTRKDAIAALFYRF